MKPTNMIRCAGFLAGAFLMIAPASAADPKAKPAAKSAQPEPEKRVRLTPEERAADPKAAAHEDFEIKREQAAKEHRFVVPPPALTPIEAKQYTFRGVIEWIGDSGVSVSQPYDLAHEKDYLKHGYKKVTDHVKRVGDKTLYQGRIHHTYDMNPSLFKQARKLRGQEVTLVFQRINYGSEIVEIRPR